MYVHACMCVCMCVYGDKFTAFTGLVSSGEQFFSSKVSSSVFSHVQLHRVAVCCGVLRCVAVCCGVLHCVALCCGALQCVAACCSVFLCMWCQLFSLCT